MEFVKIKWNGQDTKIMLATGEEKKDVKKGDTVVVAKGVFKSLFNCYKEYIEVIDKDVTAKAPKVETATVKKTATKKAVTKKEK